MLDALIAIDKDLFLFLNGLYAEFLDPIMLLITHKLTWVPLYLVFVFFLFRGKSIKHMVLIALCLGLLIFISDWGSVHLFKEVFQRLRPCHDPAITDMVRVVQENCGGQYGFVSSHAANMMAVGLFMTTVFESKGIKIALVAWAVLVSYSRIYVGVHYPLDLIGGWALAGLDVLLVIYLYKLIKRKFNL